MRDDVRVPSEGMHLAPTQTHIPFRFIRLNLLSRAIEELARCYGAMGMSDILSSSKNYRELSAKCRRAPSTSLAWHLLFSSMHNEVWAGRIELQVELVKQRRWLERSQHEQPTGRAFRR